MYRNCLRFILDYLLYIMKTTVAKFSFILLSLARVEMVFPYWISKTIVSFYIYECKPNVNFCGFYIVSLFKELNVFFQKLYYL